jgi:hypothetical protein
MVKLIKETDGSILAKEMQDGQIGIIVEWSVEGFLNRIVQAYDNDLISVGLPSGSSWEYYKGLSDCCRVKLLQTGDLLEIC